MRAKEVNSFKRGRDPKADIGIGVERFSKRWENEISHHQTNFENVWNILEEMLKLVEPGIKKRDRITFINSTYTLNLESPKGTFQIRIGMDGKVSVDFLAFGNIIENPGEVIKNLKYYYNKMNVFGT